MEIDVQEALCYAFQLGQVTSKKHLPGTRNQNYLLGTTTGKWFVRQRYPGYSDPKWVSFDAYALRWLNESAVPVVCPRKTTEEKSFWQQGSSVWQVFPFVNAPQFSEGSLKDVQALGEALALFHLSAEEFPIRHEKLGPRGETEPRELLELADGIESSNPECREPLEPYRHWLAGVQKDLSDAEYAQLPHTLVHGDIQPANILVEDDRIAAFVDLDWCTWRPRIYDLAFAILFCCSTRNKPIHGEDIWSLTQPPRIENHLAEAFVESYERDNKPLIGEELRGLRSQIVASWCHSRIAGAMKVPGGQRSAFLAREPYMLHQLLPAFL